MPKKIERLTQVLFGIAIALICVEIALEKTGVGQAFTMRQRIDEKTFTYRQDAPMGIIESTRRDSDTGEVEWNVMVRTGGEFSAHTMLTSTDGDNAPEELMVLIGEDRHSLLYDISDGGEAVGGLYTTMILKDPTGKSKETVAYFDINRDGHLDLRTISGSDETNHMNGEGAVLLDDAWTPVKGGAKALGGEAELVDGGTVYFVDSKWRRNAGPDARTPK